MLYSSGSDPLGTNAEGSSQAQALGIVGAKNAVVLEDVSNKGGGNMINMEQLYNFDPDVVLVTDAAALEIIETEAAWQELRAVKDGRVYTVPCDPYCWLSAPPSMNMILGVWWLGNLLYPEVYDYDMTAKAQEIYKVFWNYDRPRKKPRPCWAKKPSNSSPASLGELFEKTNGSSPADDVRGG